MDIDTTTSMDIWQMNPTHEKWSTTSMDIETTSMDIRHMKSEVQYQWILDTWNVKYNINGYQTQGMWSTTTSMDIRHMECKVQCTTSMDICYTLHTFIYMYVTMYEIFYIFANISVNLINKTFTVQLVSSPISWESSASPLPTEVLPSYKEEQVEIVWYIFQSAYILDKLLHSYII